MYRSNFPEAPGMHNADTRSCRREPKNFLQELKTSFLSILVGMILLLVASSLLFWNEGRAVQTAKSLDESLQYLHVVTNPEILFEENNNKMVFLWGQLSTIMELADVEYGVSINAVKLNRKVQMYQWIEHESTSEFDEGGEKRIETSYSYSPEWRGELVNSNLFSNPVAYTNPKSFPVENNLQVADPVRVGVYSLSKELIDKITTFTSVSGSERSHNPNIKLHAGMYYHTADVWNPQVGDVRVEFSFAGRTGDHADVVTVLASQNGHELKPYQTQAGDLVYGIYPGEKTPEEVFELEHARNRLLSWGLRGGGWLLLFVAFTCMTEFLNVLVSRFPVIRDVVNLGLTSLNVGMSVTVWLLIVSLGWMWYRPLVGLGLLFLAALPFITASIRLYCRDQTENRYRRI